VTFTCREATLHDTAALLEVHRAAFSTDVEADLVADLLKATSQAGRQSWVADAGGVVVGHVLLTAGEHRGAASGDADLSVMLLCPLAVLPSHQHAGVGTAMTRAALAAAAEAGVAVVCVFGDPGYYSRFGFQPLLPSGPQPPFEVGEAHRSAWQTLWLTCEPDALDQAPVRWAPPLMRPALWQP